MGLFSKKKAAEPTFETPEWTDPEWTDPEWTEEGEQARVWSEVNQHLQEYEQALEDYSNRRMQAWIERHQSQRREA